MTTSGIQILALAILSASGSTVFGPIAYCQTDQLAIFDGAWVAVNPPGGDITFQKLGLNMRQVTLPYLGAATITVSDGRDNSNLKVSGLGFDCYYLVSPINVKDMVWDLRSGSASCPGSARFRKVPPSPSGDNLIQKYLGVALGNPIPAGLNTVSISREFGQYGLNNVGGTYNEATKILQHDENTGNLTTTLDLYSRHGSDAISVIVVSTKYGWNWGDGNQFVYSLFSALVSGLGLANKPDISISTTPVSETVSSTYRDDGGTRRVKYLCSAARWAVSPIYTDNIINIRYVRQDSAGVYLDDTRCAKNFNSFESIRRRMENGGSKITLIITNEK